jgi:uncharacterized membrane protein HdeD (DUF308 family)
MAISSDTRKRWAYATALRGVLMLLAGLYAIIFPLQAFTILVIAGGALLVVDGVLGLWSLTFGGATTGNFWFDIVRNVLALITGILILFSPLLAALVTGTFLVYLMAFQAIIVGIMEIVIVLRERESYARIWPVLLSGVLYVIFGVLLILAPLISIYVLVILAGVLMVLFSFSLFGLAWRMRRSVTQSV